MNTVSWEAASAEARAAMSPAELRDYERDKADAEVALDLAQLVYDARIRAGLSQTELARIAGTSQAAISAIENASKVPTVATLRRLADALGARLEVRMTYDQLSA